MKRTTHSPSGLSLIHSKQTTSNLSSDTIEIADTRLTSLFLSDYQYNSSQASISVRLSPHIVYNEKENIIGGFSIWQDTGHCIMRCDFRVNFKYPVRIVASGL